MVAAASSLLPWSTTQLLFTHNFTFKPTKIKTSITAAAASSHSNNTFIEYGSYNFQTKSALASLNCSFNEEASENLYQPDSESQQSTGFWSKWKANSAEMSSKLAKLGLSAVLAYGLFDAVTYTTFFVLAFLGYEKSTGKNPAANLQALLGETI
ncbi:uncharacterized protein LOC126671148 isoform X2 [Mercurialis annua]|uniref:uncharacterized protein LOC126671148 isoform X2 n=1 Tax=Mercurialis annua TaxID=3986 RepID=UPI00215DFA5D|nr:uncharacterized protein LOC126671148 isoform X2 [Mercurialis annua]